MWTFYLWSLYWAPQSQKDNGDIISDLLTHLTLAAFNTTCDITWKKRCNCLKLWGKKANSIWTWGAHNSQHGHQWAVQFDSLSSVIFFICGTCCLFSCFDFWRGFDVILAQHVAPRISFVEVQSLSLLIPKTLAYIFGYMLWRQWLHSNSITWTKMNLLYLVICLNLKSKLGHLNLMSDQR